MRWRADEREKVLRCEGGAAMSLRQQKTIDMVVIPPDWKGTRA